MNPLEKMNPIARQIIKRIVLNYLLKVVDDALSKNAEASSEVGLETLVTRQYDDVGLSGNRDCEWCLSRVCTDLPYEEAKALGAFQRHPGCGCTIEYVTAKGERSFV